jgi:hypothetical protein
MTDERAAHLHQDEDLYVVGLDPEVVPTEEMLKALARQLRSSAYRDHLNVETKKKGHNLKQQLMGRWSFGTPLCSPVSRVVVEAIAEEIGMASPRTSVDRRSDFFRKHETPAFRLSYKGCVTHPYDPRSGVSSAFEDYQAAAGCRQCKASPQPAPEQEAADRASPRPGQPP